MRRCMHYIQRLYVSLSECPLRMKGVKCPYLVARLQAMYRFCWTLKGSVSIKFSPHDP